MNRTEGKLRTVSHFVRSGSASKTACAPVLIAFRRTYGSTEGGFVNHERGQESESLPLTLGPVFSTWAATGSSVTSMYLSCLVLALRVSGIEVKLLPGHAALA